MLGGNEGGSLGDELEKEISLLQRQQRRQDSANDHKKEPNLYRSGSAPPTVEGSRSAVRGLFNHGGAQTFGNGFLSEEELRSDPSYSLYYYSNVNLNPRLPPPLVSKEGWRSTQMLQGGSSALGGIGDRRKVNRNDSGGGGGRSPFSMPPGFRSKKGDSESYSEKTRGLAEWGVDGLIGLPGLGLGGKQKSIAEILQDDFGNASPAPGHPSRSASRNVFEHAEPIGSVKPELAHLQNELLPANIKHSNGNVQSSSAVQNGSIPRSYSYAAALGSSLSRSTTPDPQPIPRAPSPNSFNGISTTLTETVDLSTALSRVNLSNDVIGEVSHLPPQFKQVIDDRGNYLFNMQSGQNNSKHHPYMEKFDSRLNNSSLVFDRQVNHSTAECPTNSYLNGSTVSALNSKGRLPSHYQHLDSHNSSFLNYGLGGYSGSTGIPSMMGDHLGTSNLPHLYENVAATSPVSVSGMDPRVLASGFCATPGALESQNQAPLLDPMYLQYLRTVEYAAALSDPSVDMNYIRNSFPDILHKAYMGSLLSPHKSQYVGTTGTKTGGSNHQAPAYDLGFCYPGNPMASLAGPGSPMRHVELNMGGPPVMKNLCGSMVGPSWNLQTGYNNMEDFTSSLLEDFKSNKAKCFELSEITGHVVDFSVDQYGSRFIQQKLETATIEEKNIVFEEIIPEAFTLMTDVFGNYVIQKFFEHGLASQKRELASKLFGHVLMLSLQMYGCRVIQKAIEVVDMDQKIKMVKELDGNVMRCVRDQNGNHVIQKCIECIPEEHIQFIISTFYDQVAILSAHPYGCRVIQRILEHCRDLKTQIKVMDEVLGSVSMLAQDQYGNYVIQHVLEHGKPLERSTIIKELAGKIVQMSQQKFASNVVEKCLTFGGPSERQLLVDEMLGSTDENEPLQAMMKDQFANYVVQKVLETCDDQHRELILSRIKVHLNALKKYTYGKHIVARVEKLVAAGERRTAVQSTHLA